MDDDVEAGLGEGVGEGLPDAVRGARHQSPRGLGVFRMQIAGELGGTKVDGECVEGDSKDHGHGKDANVGKERGGHWVSGMCLPGCRRHLEASV